MGWATGSDLITDVLNYTLPFVAPRNKAAYITVLFDAFESYDWDCLEDLANYRDKDVRREVKLRSEANESTLPGDG